ncbi:MAG: tryptophan synthase subunit alpha [Myxococcota bacterium]
MTARDRIAETFAACRERNRAALVGYLTAFDPDRDTSLALLRAAVEHGVDVIELGVAFSDPAADGDAVQGAMNRARAAGSTMAGVLELAAELRSGWDGPIVLFSYANPLLQLGDALGSRLSEAGIDAVLVVDLPPEHAAELRDPVEAAGIGWVTLVAPTTPASRLPSVAKAASGFVYAVALRGVTGAALDANSEELAAQLRAIGEHTERPIAVGFGIREPEQAAALAPHVDGIVVGSAFIEAAQQGTEALGAKVASIAAALTRPEKSSS